MRFTVNMLGIIGVVLTILSMNMTWLTTEVDEWEAEDSLTYYSRYIGATGDFDRAAYSAALYLMVAGIVISISSLLGGFVILAGVFSFAIGRLMDDSLVYLGGGGSAPADASLTLGIGFYVALVAAVIVILSIVNPLDVTVGGRGPKPKYRTWHLSRK
jgi:hypothetical protein